MYNLSDCFMILHQQKLFLNTIEKIEDNYNLQAGKLSVCVHRWKMEPLQKLFSDLQLFLAFHRLKFRPGPKFQKCQKWDF